MVLNFSCFLRKYRNWLKKHSHLCRKLTYHNLKSVANQCKFDDVGVECFMTLFAFRLSFLLFSTCKNFFTGTLDGSLSRKFCLQTGYLEIFLAVNLKDWLVVSINFPISMHNFWSFIVPHFSSIAFKEGVVGIKRVVSFSNPRSKKSGSLSLCSELFVSFGDLSLLMSSVLSSSKELSLSSEELSFPHSYILAKVAANATYLNSCSSTQQRALERQRQQAVGACASDQIWK